MNRLIRFRQDCGRSGVLSGLFIADQQDWELLDRATSNGLEVGFYEVLGKHSEIYVELTPRNVTVLSEDQDFLNKLIGVCGRHVSGVDLLDSVHDAYADLDEEINEDE